MTKQEVKELSNIVTEIDTLNEEYHEFLSCKGVHFEYRDAGGTSSNLQRDLPEELNEEISTVVKNYYVNKIKKLMQYLGSINLSSSN